MKQYNKPTIKIVETKINNILQGSSEHQCCSQCTPPWWHCDHSANWQGEDGEFYPKCDFYKK